MSLDVQVTFDDKQIEQLLAIPLQLRLAPAERIMKAMAKPVLARARTLAPDSKKSGSRKKWSRKITGNSGIDWSVSSKDHLGIKVVKHNKGARVYVGGKWPKGNKLHFFGYKNKKGRKVVYWGKRTGMVRPLENPTFLQKAYDETKSAQAAAFVDQLKKELKELNLG